MSLFLRKPQNGISLAMYNNQNVYIEGGHWPEEMFAPQPAYFFYFNDYFQEFFPLYYQSAQELAPINSSTETR